MSISPIKVLNLLVDAQENLAEFIRNGPSTGLAGYVRDGYRTRCNQFANLPAWARALGNAPTGSMNRICSPYWADNSWDGPVNELPFTGGQCASNYNISVPTTNYSYRVTICSSGVVEFEGAPQNRSIANVPGPIKRIFPKVLTNGNCGANSVQFTAIGSDDVERGFGTVNVSATRKIDFLSFTPILTRAGGLPDNCGNPPADFVTGDNPPPNPPATPGPEPTDDPANPTGPPLLPLPDYDDPVGGPTPIEAPPDGGAPVPPDAQPGSPDNVGDAIAVDPVDGAGTETPFGEPDEGKVFIGCLLNFDIPEELGSIPGSAPSNKVLARVFGNASLVFSGGRGTAERVNSQWVSLMRPSGALEVTGVYVNCEPGITYTVRPISIETCTELIC